MCMPAHQTISDEVEVYGHIKNSQTRALLSILDAARIPYRFNRVDMPRNVATNTQGNQGQDKSRHESILIKLKQFPMMTHNGYKILADMTKFIYYLHENFEAQLLMTGLWPKTIVDDIINLLEWYSTKLRPFMWEFYGIMTAASQAGLTNRLDSHENHKFFAEDLEKHNDSISKLQQIHEEYLTRFKFMCEKIEQKFFTNNNKYLFGDRPTLVDYVFYQEMLSAMVLSGNGTESEFLIDDVQIRHTKLKNLTAWYQSISEVKACKSYADEFMELMNLNSRSSSTDSMTNEESARRRSNKEKRVTFAPNKSVKFSSEQEIND